MESIKLLDKLKEIEVTDAEYSKNDFLNKSIELKKLNYSIELGIVTEVGLKFAFDELNVDDGLFTAFAQQYPSMSNARSLYESGNSLYENGQQSFEGLVSGIKGKLFENHVAEQLNNINPGW